MPNDPLADPDTHFVSSNPDAGPVTRFSVPNSPGGSVYIGAERDPANPKVVVFHAERIVAIPGDEFRRFAREYGRAIRDGGLVVHKREAWEAQSRQEQEQKQSQRPPERKPETHATHAATHAPERKQES